MKKNDEITTRESAKIKRRKRRRIITLLFSVFCIYFVVTLFSQQATMYDQAKVKADIQQQISEVENEQARIQSNINFTNTDEFVERQARDKLGWVKDGELKFIQSDNY